MRIAVLNGVNLDVLDRRDAVHYGGLTLADLESRIYAWSKEFTCTTQVPPDEPRGSVRRLVP